jgi:hypothetical protein
LLAEVAGSGVPEEDCVLQAALRDLFCFWIGELLALRTSTARQERSAGVERQTVDASGLCGGGALSRCINGLYGSGGNRDGQDLFTIYCANVDLTIILNGSYFATIRAQVKANVWDCPTCIELVI